MVIKTQVTFKEENFIQEEPGKAVLPLQIWILLSIIGFVCIWFSVNWFSFQIDKKINQNPFLQVTNRQMSLFLWQNPEKMRAHMKSRPGYLPDFQPPPKLTPKPNHADNYVSAPAEVLFLYHTWDRLISGYVFPKPIPLHEFLEFLMFDEEWSPSYWKEAPDEYRNLLKNLENEKLDDLQLLSETALPMVVRQAFWGWKNYIKEGSEINSTKPTAKKMLQFLNVYPNFRRSCWCNLFPNYLASFSQGKVHEDDFIPDEDLVPFLRAAYYNFLQIVD